MATKVRLIEAWAQDDAVGRNGPRLWAAGAFWREPDPDHAPPPTGRTLSSGAGPGPSRSSPAMQFQRQRCGSVKARYARSAAGSASRLARAIC